MPRHSRLYHLGDKARRLLTHAVPLIILLALLLFFAVLFYLWHRPVSYDAKNSYLRTIAQVGGALALLTGLWFTQRTLQNSVDTLAHQRSSERNERFFKAVEQLGNPNEGVRIGAAYALFSLYHTSAEFMDQYVITRVLSHFVHTRAGLDRRRDDDPQDVYTAVQLLGTLLPEDARRRAYQGALSDDLGHLVPGLTRSPSWIQLHEVDISGVTLELAVFDGVSFKHTDLRGATFVACKVIGCDLRWTKLRSAVFTYCDLEGSKFERADLSATDLANTTGLMWDQLTDCTIDEFTKLPDDLLASPPEWYTEKMATFEERRK